jgi:hypothetical protein
MFKVKKEKSNFCIEHVTDNIDDKTIEILF